MEFSIKDYMISLLRHWKIVVLAVVLGVGAMIAYSQFFQKSSINVVSTVRYEFVMRISIEDGSLGSADKINISYGDLQSRVLNKYYDVLTSRKTFTAILKSPNIPMSFLEALERYGYKDRDYDVMKMVELEKGQTSYKLVASAPDAEFGKQLLHMYNTVGAFEAEKEAVSETTIMGINYRCEVDTAVLDEPWETVVGGGSIIKSAVMGAMIGAVLAAGIVAILHFSGERIRSYKDIKIDQDIPLLGVIPAVKK